MPAQQTVYVDPPYPAYYGDKFFDRNDQVLGRDGTLEPPWRLQKKFLDAGRVIHTADFYLNGKDMPSNGGVDYYSLGVLKNYRSLSSVAGARLRAFLIFEPPVVAPHLYRELPELTLSFECVYIHNTEGDGYSLKGVDHSRLKKLYWPQPYVGVLPDLWENTNRDRRIVVINGNHKPVSYAGELYGSRISVMSQLESMDVVDLYGMGWERWWSRNSLWFPYWRNYHRLMRVYKGPCKSKHETLSRYMFSLCFENMAMDGYITEKLFDCLYAGTIPIYLGANDIDKWIPKDVYIDFRKFGSVGEMRRFVWEMDDRQIGAMRQAGRSFLESQYFKHTYYDSLANIFIES